MNIIGRKIVDHRRLTKEELAKEGWNDEKVDALILDDGTILYPSRDYEGNGPGVIFAQLDGKTYTIYYHYTLNI